MKRGKEARVLVTKATHAVRLGKRAEAEVLAARALELAPRDPEVLRRLADIALVLEDVPTAAARLEEAIAHHPAPAPARWYHVFGETLTLEGKLDRAITAFQEALKQSAELVDTWRWLGRVLRTVGDVRGSVEAWRNVLRLSPDEWEARNDLGGALMEMRAFEEAAVALEEAARHAGAEQPLVVVNQARLEARRGRRPEAIAILEACLSRHPDCGPAQALLASVLRDEKRFGAAVAMFRRVLTRAPDDASANCGLARVLLEDGAAPEALTATQAFLRRRPGYAGALAVEALARLALGDGEGAGRLIDHQRLVSAVMLPTPPGFADLAAFNAALAAHAVTHHTLLMAPPGHATAAGLHSGSLLIEPRGPVAALEAALRAAVAAYWRGLPELPGHPFVAHRPQSAFFNIWCVVLQSGGHQIPHIHPEAWLSGVYYPQLPEAVRDGDGEQGWLEFGEADRPFPRKLQPPVARVRPREGLLVLFPSYFYHQTVPFDAPGTRISVAFDLVPND